MLDIWKEAYRIYSESDHVADEEWTRRAARLLQLHPCLKDKGVAQEAEVGFLLEDSLSQRASQQRKAHKLEQARRTAERMYALGRLLVSTYPDQPAAHRALSLAFEQFAKNAWQTNDRAAIEQNWKMAIDEARQASTLDPQDVHARNAAAVLQKRLDDFLATK